jgi:hypothetical protein
VSTQLPRDCGTASSFPRIRGTQLPLLIRFANAPMHQTDSLPSTRPRNAIGRAPWTVS